SEGRQPDEWQRVRQLEHNQYVKHPGDKNLQAEQKEMPVEKSVIAMEGTTPGNERNILYSTFKERDKGVRKGTSCKTTTAAVFVTLLGLSLLSTAGGQLTCDSRGVMVRIPQPHGCPRIGEGIVRRVQVTVATREYQ
ncbi:unnamed protein product, partial [Toxocara canis]|uniref:Glycoprotein n=1 Tax=Toxocara canis TaxID=6265 RepID=A0A183U8P6_TOXCA